MTDTATVPYSRVTGNRVRRRLGDPELADQLLAGPRRAESEVAVTAGPFRAGAVLCGIARQVPGIWR
jgi:hypothetical protein